MLLDKRLCIIKKLADRLESWRSASFFYATTSIKVMPIRMFSVGKQPFGHG